MDPTLDRLRRQAALLFGSALVAGLASACGLLRSAAALPGGVVAAVLPDREQPSPPLEQQFDDLTRYLDLMVLRIDEASLAFALAAAEPEAEVLAAKWRLGAIRWAVQLSAGPNSLSNALDLVVLATTFRWLVEDHWIPEVWGEDARPLQVAFERIEEDGWALLERYLDDPAIAEARRVLVQWRARNPLIRQESFAESPSFRTLLAGEPADAASAAPNLLGLIGLDPTAGLEPAAREVERARQLGLRALFFLQHSPRLVAAELEYRLLRLRDSPEARQVLSDAERLTVSLESVAATAATLPEAVRQEREELVHSLEQAQEPLGRLLESTRATLDAGETMSAEVNGAVRTLDAFVARFDGPDEPSEPSGTRARPFDVTEYGQAAERIGAGASQISTLLTDLEHSLPELQRVVEQSAARGERSIDRAARRLLEVGLILIAAAAFAAWVVHRLGRRAHARMPAPVRLTEASETNDRPEGARPDKAVVTERLPAAGSKTGR
ncbi:MAG TPA: hypothetical protein VF530_23420 [Planctomycetota bacterium]